VLLPGEDDEAIHYFVDLLPRIRRKYPEMEIVEFIQEEGETVFVPGGWWHGVLNLEDTIAITQVIIVFLYYNLGIDNLLVMLVLAVYTDYNNFAYSNRTTVLR
jgi:dTDP-4-dehydrorhamnose 3,5-epimerase-like enzyme